MRKVKKMLFRYQQQEQQQQKLIVIYKIYISYLYDNYRMGTTIMTIYLLWSFYVRKFTSLSAKSRYACELLLTQPNCG